MRCLGHGSWNDARASCVTSGIGIASNTAEECCNQRKKIEGHFKNAQQTQKGRCDKASTTCRPRWRIILLHVVHAHPRNCSYACLLKKTTNDFYDTLNRTF